MAAEIIKQHIPELVTAINDIVQPVSDQCLAKGLIPDSVYKRILESGGTSEDKARTLILAVKTVTERDVRCFELFLNILNEKFPFGSEDPLLTKIKEEYESSNTCQDVVSASSNKQLLQNSEFSKQISLQKMPLLDTLVESVRQHEKAYTEKILLQEQLKSRSEECEKLKLELQELKSKTQEETTLASVASKRISACEVEMAKLKERIEAVEYIIEDQGMRVKRGKSVIDVKMKEFLHAVEQERKSLENKFEEKKYEVMKVDKKWRESEKEFETKLKEKDDEVQALHRKYEKESDELKSKVKDLEHKVALQEKDIEIKNIELKHERSKTEQQHPTSPSPNSDLDFLADDDGDDYYGDLHLDDSF